MASIIDMILGGNPGDEVTNIPTKFSIEYIQAGGGIGLTTWGPNAGVTTMRSALSYLYKLINGQSPNRKLAYARFWCKYFTDTIAIIISFLGKGLQIFPQKDNPNLLSSIIPGFSTFEALLRGNDIVVEAGSRFGLPQYVETSQRSLANRKSGRNTGNRSVTATGDGTASDFSGFIQFTPEFNIPTNFNNANFYRAQDDNYADDVSLFINAPSFDRALFIRPKMEAPIKCNKKKCKKCQRKIDTNPTLYIRPTTTAQSVQAMIVSLYQTTVQISRGTITEEEGKALLDARVAEMDKYVIPDASTVYYFDPGENGYCVMVFCKRYRLKTTDCIAGFTLQGVNDFFTGNPERSANQVMMGASAVPIDEDMSDALYSPNNGIFVYNKN